MDFLIEADWSGSTHLSAILAHIGLASHHCPDVVIQAPIKCDKKRTHGQIEDKIQTKTRNALLSH